MSEERSKALAELSAIGEMFEEIQQDYDKRTDEWWNSLPEDQRQDAFYSVVKRLVKGELRDRGTYRYVLYDVFGFDASSYMMGMNCGYMELHNSIYTQEEMRELRDRELASQGIKVKTYKVEKMEKSNTLKLSRAYMITSDVMMDDVAQLGGAILFGSRSMAGRPVKENFDPSIMIGSQISDATDWDFSASYTQANHDMLVSRGFMYWPEDQLGYKDDLTEGVYIKTYPHKFDMSNPVIYSGVPTINIVLRNDHALFCQTWNSIDPEFYYKYLWKRSPTYDEQDLSLTKGTIRDIMNQLFRTAKGMI